MSPRRAAWLALRELREQGASLDRALRTQLRSVEDPRDRALAASLAYECCRHLRLLSELLSGLLHKPLKANQIAVETLLLQGLAEMRYLSTPAHAAIYETVALASGPHSWARKLTNAVLRKAQRGGVDSATLRLGPAIVFSHPDWLVDELKRQHEGLEPILAANNTHPPMWLRVRDDRDHYASVLSSQTETVCSELAPQALRLARPLDVGQLPGFQAGAVSVQDLAAQLAAPLLDCAPGERVLDACAAPGGKSTHLLELTPSIELTAVEIDATRAERLAQNHARLDQKVAIVVADMTSTGSALGRFDAILLDAPCSGTGVIRRHPDIKWLRRPDDLLPLAKRQQALLTSCWQHLRPGGRLLYTTCSILAQENEEVIAEFSTHQNDLSILPLPDSLGHAHGAGRLRLPGQGDGDGFFYALLEKTA